MGDQGWQEINKDRADLLKTFRNRKRIIEK